MSIRNARLLSILSLGVVTLSLGGCIDRAQADAKLAAACQKGVQLLLTEGYTIQSVKNTAFSKAQDGDGQRRVEMDVMVDENHLPVERRYSCNFYESSGFLGMNYSASIAQVDMGEAGVFGRKDGKILGGMEKWMAITETVDAGL